MKKKKNPVLLVSSAGLPLQGGKTTLNGFLHVAEKAATDSVIGGMKQGISLAFF